MARYNQGFGCKKNISMYARNKSKILVTQFMIFLFLEFRAEQQTSTLEIQNIYTTNDSMSWSSKAVLVSR